MLQISDFDQISLVTIVLGIISLLLYSWFVRNSTTVRYPDGPLSLPIIGNLPQVIAAGDLVKFLESNREVYGNVYTVELAGVKRVVVSGFENVNLILVKHADHSSNRSVATMPDMAAQSSVETPGLLWCPFPHWKTIRTFALHVFREHGMGGSVIESKVSEELDLFMEHYIEPHLGNPLDLSFSLSCATSNIITQMLVGIRYAYEDPVISKLLKALDNVVLANTKATMTRNMSFVKYFPGDLSGRLMYETGDAFARSIMKSWVDEGRRNLNQPDRTDLLHRALIYAKKQRDMGDMDPLFTDDNLVIVIYQLYGGGTESTATVLRWALLYMINYPDIQNKVREEIHDAIGMRQVMVKDRGLLEYTDCVIHEVMRCANVFSLLFPHTLDDELTVDGKDIPAGAELMFNMTSVVNDPQTFPEPHKFEPKRFLGELGSHRKRRLLSFGLGRRVCLGESLARLEIFIFFVTFIQKYRISHVGSTAPSLQPDRGLINAPQKYKLIFNKVSEP